MFKDKLEYLTNQPEILDKLMKSSYEELLRWKKTLLSNNGKKFYKKYGLLSPVKQMKALL